MNFSRTLESGSGSGRPPLARAAGFTLIEMLITMGIGGIVFGVVGFVSLFFARNFIFVGNHCDLQQASRVALEQFKNDTRSAVSVSSATESSIVLLNADGSTIQYTYSPDSKTLSRLAGGATRVLIRDLDSMTFSTYQRNPVGASYDLWPTATADTTKLISVSMSLSKQVPTLPVNTEILVGTKAVIRKH